MLLTLWLDIELLGPKVEIRVSLQPGRVMLELVLVVRGAGMSFKDSSVKQSNSDSSRCGKPLLKRESPLLTSCGAYSPLHISKRTYQAMYRPGPPKTSSGIGPTYFIPWKVRDGHRISIISSNIYSSGPCPSARKA